MATSLRVVVCSTIQGLESALASTLSRRRAAAAADSPLHKVELSFVFRSPAELAVGGAAHAELRTAELMLADPGDVAPFIDQAAGLRWLQVTSLPPLSPPPPSHNPNRPAAFVYRLQHSNSQLPPFPRPLAVELGWGQRPLRQHGKSRLHLHPDRGSFRAADGCENSNQQPPLTNLQPPSGSLGISSRG